MGSNPSMRAYGVPVGMGGADPLNIHCFFGVRPERSAAQQIAAVPYDVVTAEEARAVIAKNPSSFLRVSRPDAEMPQIPAGDPRVHEQARKNFEDLIAGGLMRRDDTCSLYLYRVQQDGDTFLGLCCCLEMKKIMKLAGISDIWSKTYGERRTRSNLVMATFKAFKNLNRMKS